MIVTVNLKLNGVSNDILNIQRVDGSMVYDWFELSCNMAGKTTVLKKQMLMFENC